MHLKTNMHASEENFLLLFQLYYNCQLVHRSLSKFANSFLLVEDPPFYFISEKEMQEVDLMSIKVLKRYLKQVVEEYNGEMKGLRNEMSPIVKKSIVI